MFIDCTVQECGRNKSPILEMNRNNTYEIPPNTFFQMYTKCHLQQGPNTKVLSDKNMIPLQYDDEECSISIKLDASILKQ